ncbi:MAG: elongation factor P [Acidaminococcales bacterium]|jgi:elongation factor P|nr:elongation factor P [Acidaminococcales bacterium]
MLSTNEFRTGSTVTIDGDAWQVVDFQHVKPGKGAAFVRAKLRNLCTGAVVEKTFNAGEKFPKAHIERREMEYLYAVDDNFVFMDTENFEQSEFGKDALGNAINFLKENMKVNVMFYQGKVLGIDLPNAVELTVVETDPGIRGDTATGGVKPATLDTGYVVKVPLFIEAGDVLRIDTRTGEYVERA